MGREPKLQAVNYEHTGYCQNHILVAALEHSENWIEKVCFEPFLDVPCGGTQSRFTPIRTVDFLGHEAVSWVEAKLGVVNYEHPGSRPNWRL